MKDLFLSRFAGWVFLGGAFFSDAVDYLELGEYKHFLAYLIISFIAMYFAHKHSEHMKVVKDDE